MILTGRASAGCLWAAPAVLRYDRLHRRTGGRLSARHASGHQHEEDLHHRHGSRQKEGLSVFRLNSKWWVFKRVLHQILIENIYIMKLFKFPISSKIVLKIHIVYFSVIRMHCWTPCADPGFTLSTVYYPERRF